MLDYNLEKRGEASLYEYVYQQIRDDIVAGRIAAGEHLPSKRAFASHLGISVITIENAYSQLLAEGYICSMPRRGYYACKLPDAPVLPLASQGIDRDTVSVGLSAHDVNGQVELFDALSPSALEAARLWQSALRATLASEDEREIFSPAPAQGTARLRRAIAHHLRGTRGMNVDPNNIVIGAGAQLLDTMLVQLLGADKVYAVEDPGYLRLTNLEVKLMFQGMVHDWFAPVQPDYNDFVRAMLLGDVDAMNEYMNRIAIQTFSYFDTGERASGAEPERFYHGLVLGLLSELYDTYEAKSNRESGYGRYDVMVIPKIDKQKDAMILEFKVCDIDTEGTLEDTAEAALQQIKERQYDAELIARGIDRKHIRHYGFAFQGKKVLIKEE